MARIARALNDAAVPCPSAEDPDRNPHRSGHAWTLHTVRAILGNSRYTGRQVWNRQRTDADLVDPANTGLGHRPAGRRYQRAQGIMLIYDPDGHTLRAGTCSAVSVTIDRRTPAGRR
jgi:hypothetical protein